MATTDRESQIPEQTPDAPSEPRNAPVVETGDEVRLPQTDQPGAGNAAEPAEPAASQLPHSDPSPVSRDVAEGEREDDEDSGRHQEDDAAAPGSGSSGAE